MEDAVHIESAAVEGAGAMLLIHGGAWAIPDEDCDAHRDGLRRALAVGQRLLQRGALALDVVCETVAAMEAHGAFDAGCGAVLTRDGSVELDAGLMDGATFEYGAVACVHHLRHPVRVAHRLLSKGRGEVRILTGPGAERFAEAEGFDLASSQSLICERERQRYEALRASARYHTSHPFLPTSEGPQGTVGCVARDRGGRLAAATSTGGTPYRPSGRIGDSPLPGAGYYATAEAASSATGWGEAIAAVLLCGRATDQVAVGMKPEEAARQGLARMHATVRNREGRGATGGLILLGRASGAWAFTTPRMARGGWHEGGTVWIAV